MGVLVEIKAKNCKITRIMAHLYSVQMYFCNKILISRVPLYRVKNTSFVLHCSDIFQEIELTPYTLY